MRTLLRLSNTKHLCCVAIPHLISDHNLNYYMEQLFLVHSKSSVARNILFQYFQSELLVTFLVVENLQHLSCGKYCGCSLLVSCKFKAGCFY